jgi:hypothetical protein
MTTIHAYLLLPPDWSNGVSVGRRWQTRVNMSVTGWEQRTALFTWARRTMRYQALNLSGAESNYLWRKLWRYIHKVVGLPLWPDGTPLTSEAASGQAALNVEATDNRAFEVGDKAILVNASDPDSYETGEIQSLTSTSIILTANLTYTWASGTYVYPVLAARLRSRQSIKYESARYSVVQIDAVEAYE